MNAQSKISETTYSALPRGFKMRDDGIYREVASKDGETPELVWLCSPMRVLALPRDRSGTGWGRLVEVIDPDGRAHRVTIPARMFAGGGEELRAGLLDLGLDLAPDPAARRALADLLTRWQPPRGQQPLIVLAGRTRRARLLFSAMAAFSATST